VAPPSPSPVLRLGTRGGDLALWQAREAARLIVAAHPGIMIDITIIRTTGDRNAAAPIAQIGASGVFTREIEQALRDGAIDLAVHSLKDLPTRLTDGLTLAAILERGDPRDALIAPPGVRLADLPPGARVGTSSARRRAQVRLHRPDLLTLDVRGNVPTRLAKLDRGEYDALVLACAGLRRLGLDARITQVLDPEVVMPAPGQGALAVEVRADDERVLSLLRAIDHAPTRLATAAERAVLATLGGGCRAPVGALGSWKGQALSLAAAVTSLDGRRNVRSDSKTGARTEAEAEEAGARLARHLLAQGAGAILADARDHDESAHATDRGES
jgi:hydroxymethylbilane synthase